MSTSNLLHPNDYDVYVGTMTTTSGAQSFRQLLAQTTLAGAGLPVLASWSIHGATAAVNMLGGLMTYIDYAIQANKNDTIVHATIPYFTIKSVNGTNPDVTTILIAIPASVTPTSSSTCGNFTIWGNIATTQRVVAVRVLNSGFIEIQSLNGDLLYNHTTPAFFGTDNGNLGIGTDYVLTWEL